MENHKRFVYLEFKVSYQVELLANNIKFKLCLHNLPSQTGFKTITKELGNTRHKLIKELMLCIKQIQRVFITVVLKTFNPFRSILKNCKYFICTFQYFLNIILLIVSPIINQ